MLILAGVTLSSAFWDGGIFNRAEDAGVKYNEAKAREVLADGQYEKNINPEYNQDKFLDDLIKSEIQGSDVKGDVAIVGGWAFELDRTVPKIGRPLGRADKLVFPTLTVSNPILATNYRTSSFTATAIEDKNGTYTVKVYGDLMASATVEVTGIVPSVEFTPNGSTEWKKQHTTKVAVKETGETITSMKYLWVKDDGVNEPATNLFIKDCPSDRVITGGDDTMTGTYYLWVLLTTGTGANQRTNICASQVFNFDNEKPTIQIDTEGISGNEMKVSINIKDKLSNINLYRYAIDGTWSNDLKLNEDGIELNLSSMDMGYHEIEVKAIDGAGNENSMTKTGRTRMHSWKIYKTNATLIGYEAGEWVTGANGTEYYSPADSIEYTTTIEPTAEGITIKYRK